MEGDWEGEKVAVEKSVIRVLLTRKKRIIGEKYKKLPAEGKQPSWGLEIRNGHNFLSS